jgi:hypothetical protein
MSLQDQARTNLLGLLAMTDIQAVALSNVDLYKLARDAALVPDTGKNYGAGYDAYFTSLRP